MPSYRKKYNDFDLLFSQTFILPSFLVPLALSVKCTLTPL